MVIIFTSNPITLYCTKVLIKVVEQNQVEDPLAMSLASMIMSRPGSVMESRPGSALSNFGPIVSPTKTPKRNRGNMRNAMSMNSVDFSRGTI